VEITASAATARSPTARVVEASPPRVFDRAALTAVKRWKFEPTGATSTARRTIAFTPE